MFSLLFAKEFRHTFTPLFWLQFLGAFNDNVYKNAMVVWITYQVSQTQEETGLLVSLAAGLFILPFVLFSAIAGRIAAHHEARQLIQKIKLAEVLVMLIGAVSLVTESLPVMFLALFLMGTQSAFFGPIKYSILPRLLSHLELKQGNSLFSASTFLAILLGTLLGGAGILWEQGTTIMATIVVTLSVLGYLMSLQIHVQITPAQRIDKSLWKAIRPYKSSLFAVLAISWFWFFGAIILSQLPTWTKYLLTADDSVLILLLSLFSIGIALGSALVTKFPAVFTLKYHPILLVKMAFLLGLTLWCTQQIDSAPATHLYNLTELLEQPISYFLLLFFLLLSMQGGAYIVPLYTFVQTQTDAAELPQMIAFNNILNALLMVLSAILFMLGFSLGYDLLELLWLLVGLTVIIAYLFFRNRSRIKQNDL